MPNLQAQFNQALQSGTLIVGMTKGLKEIQETKKFYKDYINQTVNDMLAADKYIKDNNVTGESILKAADELRKKNKDKPKLRDSGIDQDMMKAFLSLGREQPKQSHPIELRQNEIERSKKGKSFIIETIDLYHKTRGV